MDKMKLDTSTWKEFRVGDLFTLEPTKGVVTDDLIEGFDVPYMAAKHDGNGIEMFCSKEGVEDWISKGNCIVFVNLGAGSAGYVNYINEDFIGMSGKTTCGYNPNLNQYNGLFIATCLCQERPKYSFGRSWTGDRLKNTIIKLPVTQSGDPDWNYMENYIKSLHFKPLSTGNKSGEAPALHPEEWKEFRVGDLFPKKKIKHHSAIPEIEGQIPFISSTSGNNGIAAYVDAESVSGGCITVSTNGDCFDCFFQPYRIALSNDAEALYNGNLNQYNALFIASVLRLEKIKYAYGRKPKNDKVYDTIIKLPCTPSGDPDWSYMENYIKSLPYGDRL